MLQPLLILATIGILVGYYFALPVVHVHVHEGFEDSDSDPDQDQDQDINYGKPDGTPSTPYANQEDDPRDIPWIASWSALDKQARGGQNCDVKTTQKGLDGVTIVTTSKSCEAGMPHTRAGDRIIIPESIPLPMRNEIIAHEMIHIYQTRYPEAFKEFYRNSWLFELFKSPPPGIPDSVRNLRRSNPDTFREPWCCWMGYLWPVAIYQDSASLPSLRNAKTVWWNSKTQTLLTEPPAEWVAFFGSPSQDEHPHEIAAVLIVSGDTRSEAGRRLNNWWKLKEPFMKSY